MKKLLAILLLAGCVQGVSAQSTATENSLFEEVTGLKAKSDKFNLYMNMNGSFDAQDQDGFQGAKFNMPNCVLKLRVASMTGCLIVGVSV